MTPAEKARKTRQEKVTWALFEALTKFPEGAVSEAEVVQIFADFKASPRAKCDAFWELDSNPGRFGPGSYFSWHSRLRRCRNDPFFGPKLFALFR